MSGKPSITRVVKYIRKGDPGDPAVTYRILILSATARVGANGIMQGGVTWNIVREVSGQSQALVNSNEGNCQVKFSSQPDSKWQSAGDNGSTIFDDDIINGANYNDVGKPAQLLIRYILGGFVKCSLAVGLPTDSNSITSADVVFCVSSSGTTAPADTADWKTTAADLIKSTNAESYLWQATKTTYTNSSTAYTGKICLGKVKDFATVTEQYSLGTASASDGSWQDTTPPAAAKGKYLWTRTKLTYSNGNSTYSPSEAGFCVGYYGTDGVLYSIEANPSGVRIAADQTEATYSGYIDIYKTDGDKKELCQLYSRIYVRKKDGTRRVAVSGGYIRGYGDRNANTPISFKVYSTDDIIEVYARNTAISADIFDNYLTKLEISIYKDGDTGPTGKGISNITTAYARSNQATTANDTTAPTIDGGWATTQPTLLDAYPYMWKRETTAYTVGSSVTRYMMIGQKGSPGSQGSRGPALRGPQDWNMCTNYGSTNYQFYQGAAGEPYIDIVVYNGYYYLCKKSYSDKSILPTNTTYWQLGDKTGLISASVMFTENGFFGDAIVSGNWLISANGTIDGTTYTKGSYYRSASYELAYNLFNANSPLGADIQKLANNSSTTINSTTASTIKASVYLEAGRVYFMTCEGYTVNASYPVNISLVKQDDSNVTLTPIQLNSTSTVADTNRRTAYVHIKQTGTYNVVLSHTSGVDVSGTLTSILLVEKCFAPFFALNLLTGKTYQKDIYVKGGVRSPFTYLGRGGTFDNDFSDNIAVYSASASSYALPWTADQSGRKIVITNYYWNSNYSTSSGYAELTAPTGKYFYEDGIQKSKLKLSREAVELLGYGDTSSFYGWIVLKRIDLGTVSRYGHGMKMLAVGRVTSKTNSATIKYHTFDGTTMDVEKISGETGKYKVTWDNSNWFANDASPFIILTGFGRTLKNDTAFNDTAVFANLASQTKTSFEAWTADDASRNNGSFNFFIMNFDDWIYLH